MSHTEKPMQQNMQSVMMILFALPAMDAARGIRVTPKRIAPFPLGRGLGLHVVKRPRLPLESAAGGRYVPCLKRCAAKDTVG